MKTYKRNIPEIDTSLANHTKYLNQMNWTGIVEDDNVYALDQNSFRNAKNVYVSDNHLVSRKPLQVDELPDFVTNNLGEYGIVDMKVFNNYKIYVTCITEDDPSTIDVDETTYRIFICDDKEIKGEPLEAISKYNICSIDHYIVCFNDTGAVVFDVSKPDEGWTSLSDKAYVPITKIVSGTTESEYDNNEFTKSYKEQYIWSIKSKPILPSGNGKIELLTNSGKIKYDLLYVNKLTDYRLIRSLNIDIEDTDEFSVAKGNMCIARDGYFLFSLNGGNSWTKVLYPEYQNYSGFGSISDDGLYFFFVTRNKVFRCDLADLQWYDIDYDADITLPSVDIRDYTVYHFLNGETFAFANLLSENKVSVWYKNVEDTVIKRCEVDSGDAIIIDTPLDREDYGLKCSVYKQDDKYNTVITLSVNNNDYTKYLCVIDTGHIQYVMNDVLTYFELGTYAINVPYGFLSNNKRYQYYKCSSEDGQQVYYGYEDENNSIVYDLVYDKSHWTNEAYKNIIFDRFEEGFNKLPDSIPDSEYTKRDVAIYHNYFSNTLYIKPISISVNTENITTYDVEYLRSTPSSVLYLGKLSITSGGGSSNSENRLLISSYRLPHKLSDIYLLDTTLYYNDEEYNLPDDVETNDGYFNITNRTQTATDNDTFYIVADGRVWTNSLSEDDSVSIIYEYLNDEQYFIVPNISHSDTELYLGIGNTLRITSNVRNGTDILFNLSKINDKSFIDNITGLVNISTTEVAVFFKNKVMICAKVEDENLGFRYDYYNTKLSTGARLNDSIVNTLEGSYTIFPTRRGLASMNYQAFMATNDQVVSYISDNIQDMWTKFYDNSSTIKIIQHRTYLILSNGTEQILLYDLINGAWWNWEVPINVTKLFTDQVELRLLSTYLCIFKDSYRYMDFSERIDFASEIEWYFMSQPLHLNAPTYYKNLRQLIFQFYEQDDKQEYNLFSTQIKLYRKSITTREPEAIDFTVEGYRTFVKRFNYWKINEVQYALANNTENSTPTQLKLNGITIKYELGDEVR